MAATRADRVRQRVEELLHQGFLGSRYAPNMRIGMPIPIMNPDDGQHSWFVPLEVGPKLVGFCQILTTLELLRCSSFQHSPGKCDDCPDVADWTDADRILARAATLKKVDEQLAEPVLAYDQNPTRLAWKVIARAPSGTSRSIFVAGTAVYENTGARGWG